MGCYGAIVCFLLLIVTVYIFVPSRSKEDIKRKIAWHYYGLVETNALNRSMRFFDSNEDIVIPLSQQGKVLESTLPSDLWVELGRRGRISIHNATLSKKFFQP